MFARIVKAVDLRKCLQPRLAALLAHDPIRSPRCERVVEALVRRANGLVAGERHACIVKTRQVRHPIIRRRRHHPGVTPAGQHMRESIIVLKQKQRRRGQSAVHRIPIDGVREIDIEIGDHWFALHSHVSR